MFGHGVSPGCLQKSDGSELPHFPNYNLLFPFESDNMNLFELVQDPPIMFVVAVVHNPGIRIIPIRPMSQGSSFAYVCMICLRKHQVLWSLRV